MHCVSILRDRPDRPGARPGTAPVIALRATSPAGSRHRDGTRWAGSTCRRRARSPAAVVDALPLVVLALLFGAEVECDLHCAAWSGVGGMGDGVFITVERIARGDERGQVGLLHER